MQNECKTFRGFWKANGHSYDLFIDDLSKNTEV